MQIASNEEVREFYSVKDKRRRCDDEDDDGGTGGGGGGGVVMVSCSGDDVCSCSNERLHNDDDHCQQRPVHTHRGTTVPSRHASV